MTIEETVVARLREIAHKRARAVIHEPQRLDLCLRFAGAVERLLRARAAFGLALALALVACAEPADEAEAEPAEAVAPASAGDARPDVVSVALLPTPALTDAARAAVERGLALWAEGGCEIVVVIVVDPAYADVTIELTPTSPEGHIGITRRVAHGRSAIQIYAWTSGLAGVVAHELGHAVLWSGQHAPDDASIMSEGAWWIAGNRTPRVSPADAALMADTGRLCE